MLDFVSALPDAREGVRRLSQVLSGIVVSTRASELRKGTSSFTNGASFPGPVGSRMLSSDDAQLAQESVDRLAALIALGPSRYMHSGGGFGGGGGIPSGEEEEEGAPLPPPLPAAEAAAPGLEGLPEDQAEQYLTEMYDMLLRCRVPEALGELTALSSSALLGPNARASAGSSYGPAAGERGGGSSTVTYDEAAVYEDALRRRSRELRASLDLYVRDGGPSPARASIEGLLCGQKLGGHAQALLESICQLLLSCVFDQIWRHRDLLAQPKVRDLVVALSNSRLIPSLANICIKLRVLLSRPATLEAASHAWLLGFVSKTFTGLSRCMKAMVEFEECGALWVQLGDAFAAQLAVTQLVEHFSAAAAAVHPSYRIWRLPPSPGTLMDPLVLKAASASVSAAAAGAGIGPGGGGGGRGGPRVEGSTEVRSGETYLELCSAVEVFLEGLFHLTWHFTARIEEAAAIGPPPPLLVRDVLAAMEPEGSGSVADLLAAAAAGASAADVRSGALGPLTALLGSGAGSAVAAAAWPALVSGPATHCLAADWLAHVVARLDGGEVLSGSQGMAPEVAALAPLLHKPGHVDRDELPLLLSVCLAVTAAGAPAFIAHGGPSALRSPHLSLLSRHAGRRRSLEIILSAVTGVGIGVGVGGDANWGDRSQGGRLDSISELVSSAAVKHASRLLRLTARGLKAMAATQDAELAPYPAIHAAHSCAVAMHKILQDASVAQARSKQAEAAAAAAAASNGYEDNEDIGAAAGVAWNASALDPPASGNLAQALWPFAPPPPMHTSLLLDSFQAALLCYSAFLHPDPDKDPLTLRAVERCHEQLLDLCTADGEDLRLGVAAVAYAAYVGLLPALEAVLRAASLTCRLETLRVLLTAVLSSVPALQQLQLSRDGYLFLTLRKLIIACINLVCPHPLEYPMPVVQPPSSRRSLTLILQQCSSTAASITPASTAPNSQQGSGSPPYSRGILVPDRVAYGSTAGATALPPHIPAAAAEGGGKRQSIDSVGGRSSMNFNCGGGGVAGNGSGKPLILPLTVDLLDTVSMLARRFIEIHDGRVAAAANIRTDAAGNVITSADSDSDGDDGVGDDGGVYCEDMDDAEEPEREVAAEWGAKDDARRRRVLAAANRRRSFEREATELLPLAQLLPFALWWLAAPVADLVDALAQEVVLDDGSGSLFGDSSAANTGGGGGGPQLSHYPRASSHCNLLLPLGSRCTPELQPPSGKSDMRRRQSIDMSLASPLLARPGARGAIVDNGGGGGAVPPPQPRLSAWPSVPSGGAMAAAASGSRDRAWMVLSRCADTLHTIFRLTVTLSDLNRRAPHPDWPALIASLQPQQLLVRAVQVLVYGLQRQQAGSENNKGRPCRPRGPAFPVLLSSLLSASVCGVQYGWLVPESFGIPSATLDPAELEQLPYPATASSSTSLQQQHHHPSSPPPPPPPPAAAAGNGPVLGPLFSRVRRFTVISANPEGRAYQWAMIGDDDTEAADVAALDEEAEGTSDRTATGSGDGADEAAEAAATDGEGEAELDGAGPRPRRRRPVMLLRAATPGGAWASLPPPPGSAVVPTRALQVLVSDYGSAADKVLFELLLRGLSAKKQNAAAAANATGGGVGPTNKCTHGAAAAAAAAEAGGGAPPFQQFFWVPPSESLRLRTCSNPCCMNLSGLHEVQLRLAACPRCGTEWYCSRHCQSMHWHTGHKAKCCGK